MQVKSIRRFSILIYSILYLPVQFRHLCNTFWFRWLNEKFFESMRTHFTDRIIAPHVCHPSLSVVCDVFLLFFHIHLHITLFGSYLWCIFIIFPCTFKYYIVWLLASQIKSGSTPTSILWGHIPQITSQADSFHIGQVTPYFYSYPCHSI